jgi:hypothetical protein
VSEPVAIREAREVLERTPAVLAAWLSGLSPGWLDVDEGPGTYDPLDVLGHLIFGEETDWIPRIRIILAHGESFPFPVFDREGFRATYGGLPVDALLTRFDEARRESLTVLEALALSEADLARAGMHPAFGRVTLGQLIATWAAHDLTHLAQLARVMAKRWRSEVGPWRAYLGVMQDRER